MIVINADGSATVLSDSSVGPYDGNDDTLIGVLNNSSSSLKTIRLSGSGNGGGAFSFDGDGICSGFTGAPAACPFGSTGYEGPGTSFSAISADATSGNVDFNAGSGGCGVGLAPGASAYFSLESAVNASNLSLSIPTESGRATVVQLKAPLALSVESAGPITTTGTTKSADATVLTLPAGLPLGLSGNAVKAHVDLGLGSADSVAQVAQLTVGGGVAINATAVKAESTTGCGGHTGSTTILSLKVAGVTIPTVAPKPNTVTPVLGGLIKVITNEQIVNSDGSFTVNAVHVTAPLLNVVIGTATSSVTTS